MNIHYHFYHTRGFRFRLRILLAKLSKSKKFNIPLLLQPLPDAAMSFFLQILLVKQHGLIPNITNIEGNELAYGYLKDFWLDKIIKPDYKQPAEVNISTNNPALPFFHLNGTADYNQYIKFATGMFAHFVKDKDLSGIEFCLREGLNNVRRHSDSPVGAYVLSYVTDSPLCVNIAIADLGIGIIPSVNRYLKFEGKPEMTPKEVLLDVFRGTPLTDSGAKDTGKSLNYMYLLTRKSKGTLKVFSNGAAFAFQLQDLFEEKVTNKTHATVLTIQIPIENLPDKRKKR